MPFGQSSLFLRVKNKKKDLNASLTLTSLIDAFSILVIFLIVSGSNSSTFQKLNKLNLPKTAVSDRLAPTLRVSVLDNQYYFDNKKIALSNLMKTVRDQRAQIKDQRAILEADKKTVFQTIEPLLKLFSELGIQTIHLAVDSPRVI